MFELIARFGFNNWLGVISTTVSLASVVASVTIYIKNKGIRNEIIKNQEIGEYSKFLANTSDAIDAIKKSVALSKKTNLHDKLIKNLNDYYEQIKIIEISLKKENTIFIKDSIEYIETTISMLLDNKIESKDIAQIYFRVLDIRTTISDRLNKKII